MRRGAALSSAVLIGMLAALGVSGCSGGWLAQAEAVPEEPAELVAEPCRLFPASDLATIFGADVGSSGSGTSRIDDTVIEADSRHCRWSAAAIDASLQIAYASDFDSGDLVCLAPADPGAVEVDLGTRAWWSELTVSGSTLGRLRVCTGSSLVDITLVDDAAAAASGPPDQLRSRAELLGKLTLLRIEP